MNRLTQTCAMALLITAAPVIATAQPSDAAPPPWRAGIKGDLAFETSAFLQRTDVTPVSHPAVRESGVDLSPG